MRRSFSPQLLFPAAFVIEAFHPMNHQPLVEALQREVLPRRSSIIRVRDRRLLVVLKFFAGNEHYENSSVFRPRLVRVDEQIEEGLPMFRAAPRIKRAPLLGVGRRWSPSRCF